jgi:hypothetical protein
MRWGLADFLLVLALNHDPPDHCFMHEPLHPASKKNFSKWSPFYEHKHVKAPQVTQILNGTVGYQPAYTLSTEQYCLTQAKRDPMLIS